MEYFECEEEMGLPQLSVVAWVLLRDFNMNEIIGHTPRLLFENLFHHEQNNRGGLDTYIERAQVYLPNMVVTEEGGKYYVQIAGNDIIAQEIEYRDWLGRNFPDGIVNLDILPFFRNGRQYERYPIKQFGAIFVGARVKYNSDTQSIAKEVGKYYQVMVNVGLDGISRQEQTRIRNYLELE
jgi:hypothetical protein